MTHDSTQTPRTDAALFNHPAKTRIGSLDVVAAVTECSRQIERELAAAHKALTMYEKARNSSVYQPSPWPAVDDAVRAALVQSC